MLHWVVHVSMIVLYLQHVSMRAPEEGVRGAGSDVQETNGAADAHPCAAVLHHSCPLQLPDTPSGLWTCISKHARPYVRFGSSMLGRALSCAFDLVV